MKHDRHAEFCCIRDRVSSGYFDDDDTRWLIAEVEQLTAERDRLQRWQNRAAKALALAADGLDVASREESDAFIGYVMAGDACRLVLSDVRPQPLKENE